ncbi:MAG: hypothetical protein LBJ01_06315 [Tannerella sp.]|jgi:hypothetical protein|nr:hypothetical protein [Tannerella sp.]
MKTRTFLIALCFAITGAMFASARRSVPLRRVKSKAPALRRNHAPHETPSEQHIYTWDRRKAGALLSTRRSGTLRRAGIFDGPVVRALHATPVHNGNHEVVIGMHEAIRVIPIETINEEQCPPFIVHRSSFIVK